MITKQELFNITAAYNKKWTASLGAIDGSDALFIASILANYNVENIVEIGTASGFSCAFMVHILEKLGKKATIITIDKDTAFFADRNKLPGYLLDEHNSDLVTVHRVTGKTSLDIEQIRNEFDVEKFDIAFIDGNHQHPWPTIDSLVLLPHMMNEAILIHHDLQLYKVQLPVLGIGSKFLYNSIHDNDLINCEEYVEPKDWEELNTRNFANNIFGIKYSSEFKHRIIERMQDSFYLPWNLVHQISLHELTKIHNNFIKFYDSNDVVRNFALAFDRYQNMITLRK